ncbi:MAG: MBOAT family protein [Bacteroidetes bacterium]|nr:MBOAT family protein [Bacteroidota bacterium]MBK9671120.1 MBOAT family protein [Bacteroidota bacterium]
MLFNSIDFILFFLVVTPLYFLLPFKFRWLMLLLASCYFYMAFVPIYILILGATIVIDYFAGIWIERSSGRQRKLLLVLSLISNIGVLAVFKYYNFLNENFSLLTHSLGFQNPIPYLSILLPIGLSFHTFQAMSYTIEVYRGNQKAEQHFGIYSLYVMFYPQLVAGPIERPQNILHQLKEEHKFNYTNATQGLKLMAWGMFKKVVIADRLATMVNEVYDHSELYTGIPLIIATVFFAFQIYCDFSGYSDIAIGAARVMGINLMLNFNRPYSALSISEFWGKWHISLSTWFRDYLYIPLGGNRVAVPRWYFNLFCVFLLSGLWHGASWNYIIWGALHGFYLVFALLTQKYRDAISKAVGLKQNALLYSLVQRLITFILVAFAWIFFRAKTFASASYIVSHLLDFAPNFSNFDTVKLVYLGKDSGTFLTALVFIALLQWIEKKQAEPANVNLFSNRSLPLRWTFYLLLMLSICLFGVFHTNAEFIYFQF